MASVSPAGVRPDESGPPDRALLVEGRDLRLRLGTTDALRGVDIGVPPGGAVAVTGRSGSGKSSLLHCLAGVIRPTSGSVLFEDRRIDHVSDAALSRIRARDFGFVFQFSELLPELSLSENVALPLRLGGASRREAAARARDALALVGVEPLAGRHPYEVSGGELQRAAIARGVVHQPKVVFADEPTGALDSENADQVLALLFDVVRAHGAALVIVTHDDGVASRADRVVRLHDGRIADAG